MQVFFSRRLLSLAGLAACALAGAAAADHVMPPAYTDGRAGLPQNSVRTVHVDRDNLVWVGTERGLARFDGHRFINFSEADERVPVDVLTGLFGDSHGRIWTNWYRNNPRVLSPDRGRVVEIEPRAGEPDDLREAPTALHEDSQGTVWFTGKRTIYWMEPDGRVGAVALPGDVSKRSAGAGDDFYVALDNTVYRVDVRERPPRVDSFTLPGPGGPGPAARGSMSRLVTWRDRVVACSPAGVFLLGRGADDTAPLWTADEAPVAYCTLVGDLALVSLRRTDADGIALVAVDLVAGGRVDLPAGLPAVGSVAQAMRDSHGSDWVVVDGRVYRRQSPGAAFEIVELRARVFGNMPAFAESRGGEIWIATDGAGLARLAPHRNRFVTVTPPPVMGSVTQPQVRRIAVDRDGRVWLGTDERGINRWNRETGRWRRYTPDGHGSIRQVAVTRDGSVWAADNEGRALLRYDEASDDWIRAWRLLAAYNSLKALPDGDLLIASGPALIRYSPATGRHQRINRDDLPSNVRAAALDGDGDIWLGIHDYGLLKLLPSGRFERWTTADSGLTSDQLFALEYDPDGRLWIGAWHGGLQRFDPASESFETWGAADGLPDDTVFGVRRDDQGFLWLSTYRGLVRFRPCDEPGCRPGIRVFNRHDGLQGDEFDAEAHYRAPDGELFFGGAAGFNAFHPGDIHLNTTRPLAAITRATVDDRPLPGANSAFEAPVSARLPHDFGELRIELSSLDYNAPEKNRYQYRLDADAPWSDLDGPELLLRGLPEGERRLAFRGSNNDGFWSENPLELSLTVLPPPWRHPLMLALYAALLLFMPLLYYGRRQARLVRTRRLLEQQVAERTRELEMASSARERFFANISHEIAAPLHMILLMLEQQRHKAGDADAAVYRSATGYAAQLLAYLRQLVEGARSFEADNRLYRADVALLVNKLVVLNRTVASGRHIALVVERMTPGEIALYRHSAQSILSNLLCNALIHAPEGGEVRIRGRRKGSRYRLTVTNTLHPDHPLDLEAAMQRGRRGAFDATAFGGHGLGLSIVTESLESLGGELRRRVTDDGWVRFDAWLPLADSALPPLPEAPELRLDREQELAIETVEHAPGGPVRSGHAGPRVLVIEDDRSVSVAMASLLGDAFRVTVAPNAHEGIRLARETLPEVVLCDLFLPDESGFEVLKAVRDNRMTMNALFIMVTASVSEVDRETGIRLGVDHFVNKPVSAGTIQGLIHNHLALARQRDRQRRAEELRQRARGSQAAADPEQFERAFTEALDELYADPATTVEDLQLRLAMGYSALNRRCREQFGKTPKRLLVEKRIDTARELLHRSGHKVGVIAELTGFSSHAQFASAFKRLTGMSPAEYRNKARRRRGS